MAHFFMVVQTSSHNKHVNEDTSLTLKNRKTVYLINFRSQKELTQVLKIASRSRTSRIPLILDHPNSRVLK